MSYFVAPRRTCHGGSPRIVLLVDAEGDGLVDFAANGHVAPLTNYTGCVMNKWVTEDLTDDLPRWEITGASFPGVPGYPYLPWKTFAGLVASTFPNHKVRAGFLLDGESCSFAPIACGKAYFDLVTLENRTLEIWQDTVKK